MLVSPPARNPRDRHARNARMGLKQVAVDEDSCELIAEPL
jgi:hypothetical protein